MVLDFSYSHLGLSQDKDGTCSPIAGVSIGEDKVSPRALSHSTTTPKVCASDDAPFLLVHAVSVLEHQLLRDSVAFHPLGVRLRVSSRLYRLIVFLKRGEFNRPP